MTNEMVSRRTFLSGSGAIAGAAALGGMTMRAPASEAYGVQSPAIEWDEEADIVVLGYGIAGMAAARTASDAGASVIVLEKAPEDRAGGATRVNGGTFALLSSEAYLNASLGAIDQELCERMVDADTDFSRWLIDECGVVVINDMFVDGLGRALWEAAHNVLSKDENVTIHFETRANKLVKGTDGEIQGVIAEFDGATKSYKARKAVMVCTGSYVGNKELVWGSHYPCLPYEICTSPYNEGDGVFMIADAGGAVMKDTAKALEFFGWAMRTASEEVGTAMLQDDANWRQNDFTHARIFVNKDGHRFMAEDVADTHDRTDYAFTDFRGLPANAYNGGEGNGYVNLPMWGVYDSKILAQGSLWMAPDWSPAHTYGIGEWSDDNMAEVEKGWILKADTLEELAGLMNSTEPVSGSPVTVPADALVATVEEYNQICIDGVDPFGKNADYLVALDTPPYYAIELVPALGYTNSGVPSNNDSQVLTWSNEVVPRLYCAGDIGQGMRLIMLTMNGCAARAVIGIKHALGLEDWPE